MRSALVDGFLLLAVAAGWLGALGFTRLSAPLDRLHCVTFVNTVCGGAILAAALTEEGFSTRAGKIFLILLVNLLCGAGIAHATGRAVQLRKKA